MKRAILLTIFISACLCFIINSSYACDELPVPDIVSPTGTVWVSIDGYVDFNGYDSFDPDDAPPYGEGNGIDEYHWKVWDVSASEYVFEDYEYDPYYTIYPGDFGEPGSLYRVELWVKDDEGNLSEENENYCVSVIGVEITEPSSPEIIAVGGSFGLESCGCPDGGDYDWSKDTGPGSVTFSPNNEAENPYFSSNVPGVYTVELEYTLNDASDSDTSKTITVVEVDSVTVDANATYISAKNWAAVKDSGEYVIVEAVLNPTIPDEDVPSVLTWTGGSAVSGQPLKRKVSKGTSAKTTVTATCGTSSDYVDIWIIWSTCEIRTDDETSPGNTAHFPTYYYIDDSLGPKNDEDDGITVAEACGKMEGVFSLSPEGIHNIVDNWAIVQTKTYYNYENGSYAGSDANAPDGIASNYCDLDPNDNDPYIYCIDGPTCGFTNIIHTREVNMNLTLSCRWNGAKCSDDYYWYYQARVDVDEDPNDTMLNDIGTGHIGGNWPPPVYYDPRE